jgi:hypothetical protein
MTQTPMVGFMREIMFLTLAKFSLFYYKAYYLRLLQKSEKMSFRQAFSRNPDFNYLKRLDPR